MPSPDHPAYPELRERLAAISDLGRARALLAWDERTMMPRAGAAGRAEQIATLVRIRHERLTDERLWELLEATAEWGASLPEDSEPASTIRVARRDAGKARRVPAELRAELARAASVAEAAWVDARAGSDFAAFLPHLERNVALRREYAALFDDAEHPYDPLLDDFEPGASTAEVERVLDELATGLPPLLAAIAERGAASQDNPLRGSFGLDAQRRLVAGLVGELPLETGTWRLDETAHPFATSIAAGDVRLTTRFDERDLGFALFSALHEAGHGIYEAGVPAALRRGPLGRPASLAFHESQSRLWENWVGRSRPFTELILARLRSELPDRFAAVGADELHRAVNRVEPSLIRVEADEVTYNLHVVLRFELELALFERRLEPAELPEAWNERVRTLLGLEVPDDARGVLQDVHWAAGSFGYFPTYAIGNVIAAQLAELAAGDLGGLDRLVGDPDGREALREWLTERVHRHGGKLTPAELAERALGGPPRPAALLGYLAGKYGELYGL